MDNKPTRVAIIQQKILNPTSNRRNYFCIEIFVNFSVLQWIDNTWTSVFFLFHFRSFISTIQPTNKKYTYVLIEGVISHAMYCIIFTDYKIRQLSAKTLHQYDDWLTKEIIDIHVGNNKTRLFYKVIQ